MTFQEVLSRIAEGVRGESDLDAILVPVADLRVILAALPTPPADDVREALAALIDAEAGSYNPVTQSDRHDLHEGLTRADGSDMADWVANRILSRFEVRPRGPVTDAEVDAAADAICMAAEGVVLVEAPMSMREQYRREARAALEAAREVRPYGTVTDAAALAKAWDEGFTLATRNNPNHSHPLAQSNPYRGEARS